MPGSAENPFSMLIHLMRNQGAAQSPPSWGIGEVVGVSPLRIAYGGIQLEETQLFAPATNITIGMQVAILPDEAYSTFLILGTRSVN